MGISSRVVVRVLFCGILLFAGSAFAAGDDAIPKDTCILELTLPEKATVSVDGQDYGTDRKLTFRGLKPGLEYESTLEIRFSNGKTERKRVTILGGLRVRLNIAPPEPPAPTRPELVLQLGHT